MAGTRMILALLAGGATVLSAVGAATLPGDDQPPAPKGESAGRGGTDLPAQNDADSTRAFLRRRMDEFAERRKVFNEALEKLDAGASVEDVRKFLRERTPTFFGPGGESPADRPPPQPGERPERRRPLTDEDRQAIRDVLQQVDPEALKRADELRDKDPKAADEALMKISPRIGWMIELRRRDPEMYKFRMEEFVLSRRAVPLARSVARQEGDPRRDEGKLQKDRTELRDVVARRLDLRAGIQALEISRLQERLSQLKKEIDSETAARETRVQAEMDKLMEGARDGVKRRADPANAAPARTKTEAEDKK